jgi:hypothetical protein
MEISHDKSYSVAIVGGGMGGLGAAGILSQAGHRVLLLEAHNKIGGLSTWFYRENKKHLFQVTQNLFPKRMQKSMIRIWGKAFSNYLIDFDQTYFFNGQLTYLPYRAENLGKFFVERQWITNDQWKSFLLSLQSHRPPTGTIEEYLQHFFGDNKEIIYYLYQPLKFAKALNLQDSALPFWQTLCHFFPDGPYLLNTSLPAFFNHLKSELQSRHVEIKINHPVKSLTKVREEFQLHTPKKIFHAKSIIWNAPLNRLAAELNEVPTWNELKVQQKTSIYQVYMGLDQPLPRATHIIFIHKDIDPHQGHLFYDHSLRTLTYTFQSNPFNSNNKKEISDKALILATQIYGEALEVGYVEASTPRTVERYTGHPMGSAFGTNSKGSNFVQTVLPKHSGIYFCGAFGESVSGWQGVLNYAQYISNEADSFLTSYPTAP